MQSTIREHRDGGNAGGVFSRYNIIKVWPRNLTTLQSSTQLQQLSKRLLPTFTVHSIKEVKPNSSDVNCAPQIQKVVNKKLRERYTHRQKEIADENHNHHNERMLFHGNYTNYHSICVWLFFNYVECQVACQCLSVTSFHHCALVFHQVHHLSTPSSTKASMSATLTSEGCLELGSTLQKTPQRAISTSTVSVEAQAAPHTKTDPATYATGNSTHNT